MCFSALSTLSNRVETKVCVNSAPYMPYMVQKAPSLLIQESQISPPSLKIWRKIRLAGNWKIVE
jgi:hypothetical protein